VATIEYSEKLNFIELKIWQTFLKFRTSHQNKINGLDITCCNKQLENITRHKKQLFSYIGPLKAQDPSN
jgi:hypothetical protein